MSHFACTCGHSIVDRTDFLPYKAYFLPGQDTETALDPVIDLLAGLIEAREQGKQDEFLAQHVAWSRSDTRPLRELIGHLFSHPTFASGRKMYECEQCGRLWVQARPDKNEWVSYQPESATRGILRHEGSAPHD